MNHSLTDAMVADMDETADFMHQKPQFPTVASARGISPSRVPTQTRIKGLQSIQRHGISIAGREQGQADADKRSALVWGGI
ncbi:hypothetical protein [Variovorax paradoxus]|uniref:Uncharacterized protein n=1 Tax=Variovorax paradoxus TaxID=34073 RepID=A0A679JCB0_VARPD|nr:hypothetical protein VVAX_04361 [Variovorax paradoxus]